MHERAGEVVVRARGSPAPRVRPSSLPSVRLQSPVEEQEEAVAPCATSLASPLPLPGKEFDTPSAFSFTAATGNPADAQVSGARGAYDGKGADGVRFTCVRCTSHRLGGGLGGGRRGSPAAQFCVTDVGWSGSVAYLIPQQLGPAVARVNRVEVGAVCPSFNRTVRAACRNQMETP